MGLPLACQFAYNGAHVTACDINPTVIEAINNKQCPIDEPGVPELLAAMVDAGRLVGTTDTNTAIANADVIVVIVPVLLTENNKADTSIIESVTNQIGTHIKKGALVSYETTLPVGTTRQFAAQIGKISSLKPGEDFFVSFSPERVKSRYVLQRLTEVPKVVGGINQLSAEKAETFYSTFLGAPVINVQTVEAAELVKLAGMLYRDVNIALSNQLAAYAETVGADIYEVIKAANTNGEANLLIPGIGVGGHCTPVYPYFIINDSQVKGVPVTLAAEARRVNEQQTIRALDQLEKEYSLVRDKKVAILGLAFRPEVKEHICSPVFSLAAELKNRGANVMVDDPLYSPEEILSFGFEYYNISNGMDTPELLILNTAHSVYANLNFTELSANGLRCIYDGRALWKEADIPDEILYLCVGV